MGRPDGYASGYYATGASTPILRHVSSRAEAPRRGSGSVPNLGADLLLEDVTATGVAAGPHIQGGIGVSSHEASTVIRNSALTGQGGTSAGLNVNSNGTGAWVARVERSELKASSHNIEVGRYFKVSVAASPLDAGPVQVDPLGTLTCAGVHDEHYGLYSGTCPP